MGFPEENAFYNRTFIPWRMWISFLFLFFSFFTLKKERKTFMFERARKVRRNWRVINKQGRLLRRRIGRDPLCAVELTKTFSTGERETVSCVLRFREREKTVENDFVLDKRPSLFYFVCNWFFNVRSQLRKDRLFLSCFRVISRG